MDHHFIWNTDPILIKIGFLELRYYGLLFAGGIFTGYYIMRGLFRQRGIDETHLDSMLIYVIGGVVLGAHVIHLIFYEPEAFVNNPIRILQIGMGLSSHGGALGGILGLSIYCRRKNIAFMPIADCFAVSALLSTSFIRLGNFFNSEILGKPSMVPWAIIFPLGEDPGKIAVPRHPSQLYELMMGLVIFAICYPLFKKQQSKREPGFFFFLSLLMYFTFRFFLEFFKDNQSTISGAEKYLTMGQWLSLPVAIFAMGMIYRYRNLQGRNLPI